MQRTSLSHAGRLCYIYIEIVIPLDVLKLRTSFIYISAIFAAVAGRLVQNPISTRRGVTLICRCVVGWHLECDRFSPGNLRWRDGVSRPADCHQGTVGDERAQLETDDVLQQLKYSDDGRHEHVRHDQVRYLHVAIAQLSSSSSSSSSSTNFMAT